MLTPPTVAPVLAVSADLGSITANLSWSASNKTSSPGFHYRIESKIGAGTWGVAVPETNELYYNASDGAASGDVYYFRVTPFNAAGDGPVSNTVNIVLPGESEAPTMSGPTAQEIDLPIDLEWSSVPGADNYTVERSTNGSTFGTLTNTSSTTTSTSESSVGLYYYRVTPYAGAFEGITSNTVEVSVYSPSQWLLRSGYWDDTGVWDDNATWP